MSSPQTLEVVTAEALPARVTVLRELGYRIVQIGATRLADTLELTYSFDLNSNLVSLRLNLPAAGPRVQSISSIYLAAFLYENEIHDLFGLQVDGMAVDFHGHFYKTSVKHAFATPPLAPPAKPAAPTAPTPTA